MQLRNVVQCTAELAWAVIDRSGWAIAEQAHEFLNDLDEASTLVLSLCLFNAKNHARHIATALVFHNHLHKLTRRQSGNL